MAEQAVSTIKSNSQSPYLQPKNGDKILQFYNELLGINQTHFGIWQQGDELTLDNMRDAISRYTDFLINLIPEGVDTVLDIGCGYGGVANRINEQEFTVKALTLDQIQIEHCRREYPGINFFRTGFLEFTSSSTFDLLLMSESSQYFDINLGLQKSSELLKTEGFLLVADYYFQSEADHREAKGSGHNLAQYQKSIANSDFQLIEQIDITERILPTLAFAYDLFSKSDSNVKEASNAVLSASDPQSNSARFIQDGDSEAGKIWDYDNFKRYKTYQVFLLKKIK